MKSLLSHTLTAIYWHDIPSQVIATNDRDRESVVLLDQFQHAIDRAAMFAKGSEVAEYIDGWRKEKSDGQGDLRQMPTETKRRCSARRLNELVANAGFEEK